MQRRKMVPWPESSEWIQARLPSVVDDAPLHRRIERTLRRYDAESAATGGKVLVYGDVGLHNLALDPATEAKKPRSTLGEVRLS